MHIRKFITCKNETYNMSKIDQDKSYFLAFCIEQYKAIKGMDGAEVARLFFENGVASYLLDNFEVLHTQSRQWLMEEIDDMFQKNEVGDR